MTSICYKSEPHGRDDLDKARAEIARLKQWQHEDLSRVSDLKESVQTKNNTINNQKIEIAHQQEVIEAMAHEIYKYAICPVYGEDTSKSIDACPNSDCITCIIDHFTRKIKEAEQCRLSQ